MSVHDNKRKQELSRKKKQNAAERKKQSQSMTSWHLKLTAEEYAQLPIHECLVSDSVFRSGIGYVVLSRKLSDSVLAIAVVLLDVYCLGAKDAFVEKKLMGDYPDFIRNFQKSRTRMELVEPAYAAKLIKDCVAWARGIGLEPHHTYSQVEAFCSGIDVTQCKKEFKFGKNGLPTFINGPFDSPAKCYRIIDTLQETVGTDNFRVMLLGAAAELLD